MVYIVIVCSVHLKENGVDIYITFALASFVSVFLSSVLYVFAFSVGVHVCLSVANVFDRFPKELSLF